MREIKFRAWTGVGGMTDNIIVGKFGTFYVNPGKKGDGLDEKDSASLTPFTTVYPKEMPVMQYTGLKDKKGNEIWEGDILMFETNVKNVGKGKHYWEVFLSEKGQWCARRGITASRLFEKAESHKVVGNIYENPELLTI